MRPGVPWNIKDISPEAREAAQVAASRAGLSLGEWLSQAIAQEAKTLAAHEAQAAQRPPYRPQTPAPQQPIFGGSTPVNTAFAAQPHYEPTGQRTQTPTPAEALHIATRNSEFTVVAHGLRELADRLENTERRQAQAISAINQNVAAMADKVDAADRIKTMAETAFATAAEAINQSTRDQSAAFESLEKTVSVMNERLQTVEASGQADATARATLGRLEAALDGFKARLSDAERRGSDAQSSLENWVKTLNARIEQSGNETAEALRASASAIERNVESVRSGLAEQERKAQERAEAMAVIQNGLLSIRSEISETDRRARESVAGLEKWVKDLTVRFEQANPAADIQRLSQSIDLLRQDVRSSADSVAAEAVIRERTSTDLRTQLEAATGRLTTQIAQAEARSEGSIQALRSEFASIDGSAAHPNNVETDAAFQSLNQAVERLSLSVANSDQANVQTAQRQAAAIRKVEDMLQGFARGLDSIGDIAKGPLSQPMAAVQSTLETITAKIEESDARGTGAIATMEQALKALSSRIEISEARQSHASAQLDLALKSFGDRLDGAETREKDLHQKLEDSFRDVVDRIEDSERKAGDAIEAVETGMGTINQRLDAADRRQKEAIAGLRLTVDGLVAKAAAEPLLQRSTGATHSFSPQLLTAAPPPAAYAAPTSPKAVEPLPTPPSSPALPAAVAEAFAASLPESMPPQRTAPSVESLAPAFETPAAEAPPRLTDQRALQGPPATDDLPPPTFDDLLANAQKSAAETPSREPLPPLEAPSLPKRADDFLAQARRAAQAAALADAQQQASSAATPTRGKSRPAKDPYAQDNGDRNWGRLALGAFVLLALIAGAIALIILAPWRSSGDEVNRPAPGSSLGEMMTPDATQPATELQPQADVAPVFTDLPPPPEAQLDPAPPSLAATSPADPAVAVAPVVAPAGTNAPTEAAPQATSVDVNLENRAKRGDAKSQYALATQYAEGRNAPRDPAKAFEWLNLAAKGGLPPAQYRLGALYERGGDGVNRDPVQARVWYEKAALNGNRKAMHNLAVLHAEGVGTPRNLSEAAKWFQRGAEFGLTDSQYNLGVLYEGGMGVAKNPSEAAKWFAIAAAQGDADAAVKLQALKATMSPADVDRALGSARAFSPKTPSPNANDPAQAGG